MDETWVHHFDPETKRQNMSWKKPSSSPTTKYLVVSTDGKVMASVFWDREGIIFIDYMAKTITGQYYAGLIPKVRETIREKRRGNLTSGVLFYQDNAPVHCSEVALKEIHNAGFQILGHPLYSPDSPVIFTVHEAYTWNKI